MNTMNPTIPYPQSRSLWPYAIIAWMALFATGVVSYIVFAQGHRMELVRADYYEQDVRFQERMDRVERTRAMPHPVSVAHAGGRITLTLPAEHARAGAVGTVELYRPSDARLDRELPLAVDAHGGQTIDARDLRPGLWKVRVSWTAAGEDYFHDESVVIGS